MSRFTQELSRYRKKNAFQTLPELAQEVGWCGSERLWRPVLIS